MEHIVYQQLKSYWEQQHILHPTQHGFHSKKSCCSALLDLSCHLVANKNNGQYQLIAALNYTRAYDTINHSILLHKMAAVGFDANALSWFTSHLIKRVQYVHFNGVQSDQLPVSCGVPEGNVMGPTLFLLYVNDLFAQLPHNSVIAYTDDVTLLASGDSLYTAAESLQLLLDTVCRWSTRNCLCLNSAKCSYMCIVPSKCNTASDILGCAPSINGDLILYMQSVKILGVHFTDDLDWRHQAKSACTQISRKLSVTQDWRLTQHATWHTCL